MYSENPSEKSPHTMQTQIINVSGRKFEVSEIKWTEMKKNIPDMYKHEVHIRQTDVFLERHASAFESILYKYQGGDLHLPADLCPASFRKELEFWGIDETCLASCCFRKFVSYFDDEDVLMIMEKDENAKASDRSRLMSIARQRGWRGIQAQIWLILNEPFYSKSAKVYFMASALLIVLSLLSLIAGTHPDFQRQLNTNEWQIYFGHDWYKYKDFFETPSSEPESITEPSGPETETSTEPISESTAEPEAETTAEPEAETTVTTEPEAEAATEEPVSETTSEPEAESETKENDGSPVPLPENAFVRYIYLEYIEYACVSLFTIDLFVRFVFCPFRHKLLYSFLNWNDIFALTVMYTRYTVEALYPKEKYESSALDILHCLQIVRIFRLFRLVKNFAGFRVLLYAFRASFKEMMLMMLFLLVAMLIFSSCAFFSGDDVFPSIPDALWWSVVTMTTVGYGDIVPKIGLSKVIGVFCAISGVCLIAVIIPIFVNNFVMFYAYSKVWGKKRNRDCASKVKIVKVQAAK